MIHLATELFSNVVINVKGTVLIGEYLLIREIYNVFLRSKSYNTLVIIQPSQESHFE